MRYEKPEMEILRLEKDVICASGSSGGATVCPEGGDGPGAMW